MEQIIIAIVAALSAIIVALIGVKRKKPENELLSEESQTLIQTLKFTVDAQSQQIATLKDTIEEKVVELAESHKQIEELTERVSKLEQLTIAQALRIRQLENAKTHKGGDHIDD